MSLPSGNVTFLFTDAEGSTQAWELHPDAMPRAMRRHQEAVRAAVEARDGVVVKDTGDGLFAVFSDAASGLAAAMEAQIGLAGIEWGEAGPLRARMGLHAGRAEPVEGDYHGSTVNRCARIIGVGHGARSSCRRPHRSVSTRFRRTSRFSTCDRTGCGSRRPLRPRQLLGTCLRQFTSTRCSTRCRPAGSLAARR